LASYYVTDLREQVQKKIDKILAPPPVKTAKPLPRPDDAPRKKRGGRRVRKMKDRYAITEIRKQANRMTFGSVRAYYIGCLMCIHGRCGVMWNRLSISFPSYVTPMHPRSKRMLTRMTWGLIQASWEKVVCQVLCGHLLLTRRHKCPYPRDCSVRYILQYLVESHQ
jgi:hypothetical protein